MPKFKVEQKSSKRSNDSYKTLRDFLESDEDLRRFDPKMKVEFNDSAMTAKINSSQFKADIFVTDHDMGGSHISIHIDLPLLLSPFKGKVEQTLQKKLAKYFA